MEKKAFRERTINDFLDDLGSRSPAPGGGAAAGLLGAQACALAEMVCHLTESNKNYAQFHEKAGEYAAVFNMARSIFLDLMDEDAANFLELMETLRSIRNLPLEERQEKQLEAFKKAIAVPRQMAQTMSELLPSFTNLLLKGNKNALSDSIMAAQSAIACIQANHCLNLGEFCFSQPHIRIQEVADLALPVAPQPPSQRRKPRVSPAYRPPIRPKEIRPQVSFFDPKHPLYQKAVVFTGELSIDRREAMQRAVNVGAVIKTAVSRKTDFLVVGRQYDGPGGTATVSNKEEKARAILAEGKSNLCLLTEAEFFRLLQGSLHHTLPAEPRAAATKP